MISATTGSGPGFPNGPCVSPPKEREREYREVLDDYQRPKAPRQLKRALAILKPYVFASPADVNEFIDDRAMPRPGHQPNERFQGIADLFTLSDVSFNRRRTLALTAISSFCGGLCGEKQWKVFEKQPTGQWKELPWSSCVAIAKDALPTSPFPQNHPFSATTIWRALEKLGRLEEARAFYQTGIDVTSRTGDRHTQSELQAALDMLPI